MNLNDIFRSVAMHFVRRVDTIREIFLELCLCVCVRMCMCVCNRKGELGNGVSLHICSLHSWSRGNLPSSVR